MSDIENIIVSDKHGGLSNDYCVDCKGISIGIWYYEKQMDFNYCNL